MLEAPYTLSGPLPAGTWGLVGDGIVAGDGVNSVTALFEVRWRKQAAASDAADVIVLSAQNSFVRDPDNRFKAVLYETRLPAPAVPAVSGDKLLLRVTALRGDPGASFILNGDGKYTNGRIPHLDLPRPAQAQ